MYIQGNGKQITKFDYMHDNDFHTKMNNVSMPNFCRLIQVTNFEHKETGVIGV